MGCNCGGGSATQLGNYEVKDTTGKTVKKYSAVTETEVKVFVAQNPGTTWHKTS